MSVRVGDRKEGHLQVLEDAKRLRQHSFQLCTNEKIYPKSKRWAIANTTLQLAIDAANDIAAANVTYIKDGSFCEQDFRSRHALQVDAMQKLQKLIAMIELAKEVGYLGDRTEYWVELVSKTKEHLRRWMNSDEKRYLALTANNP